MGSLKSIEQTVLSECSFISNKVEQASEMTIRLKSNLYVGPVDIFLFFFLIRIWRDVAAAYAPHVYGACRGWQHN